MGTFKDQVKGGGREIKGKVKEEYGQATGQPHLEGEGRREKVSGRMQKDTARATGEIEGAVRETTGTLKREVGDLVDDRGMEARGEGERLKGKLQRKLNE